MKLQNPYRHQSVHIDRCESIAIQTFALIYTSAA
jgi:hypothetical protein